MVIPLRLVKITYVKGSEVYWENIVTIIRFTISSFVWSTAVISMKTLVVFMVIFEWSPLMMGGREQTVRFES